MKPIRVATATTGWGMYCACSWTWCIGMFLPVILLSRYGWWGFLVFAIPNVLGCAAFGYVVRTRIGSQEMVEKHRPAMRAFSLITIAYHVFFLGFLCWLLLPAGASGEQSLLIALFAPVVVVVLSQVLAGLPERTWPWLAVVIYAGSLAVFAMIGIEPLNEIGWRGEDQVLDAAWLVPVLVFGFLLCPYLDLTFHRALQASPSRHAFGVFGVAFAVMIILTCAYWDVLRSGLSWLVLGHILAQTVFTVSAHTRELWLTSPKGMRDANASPPLHERLVMLSPLIALPIAFLGAFSMEPLAVSVDNYLRFLVFYGLAFPAYVMLFMGRGALAVSQRNVILLTLTCLAFAPLYEAGFLHGHAWVLIAPPAVLLLWRARLTRGGLPEPQNGSGEATA